MKANLFRPVAFWKSVMMTVPETAFFELVRSVFGKIKTPFNKQGLVNDLESFLSRDDVQKAAAAYIERQDAMVIAAVAALGEPAPGELESFFSGEMSYAELSGIIVNLEERFILYRLRDEARPGGAGHLALNPVLQKVLAPAAENLSLLFPSLPAEAAGGGGAQKAALVDDRLFAALLSFASRGEVFLKNEGEIRKKFIENGSVLFPGIDLQAFLGAFAAIGLLYVEDGKLLPSYARFSDFAALGRRGRLMWCAAGMAFYGQSQVPFGLLEHLAKMGVQNNVALAGRLLDSLEPERLYPEKTLKRLMDILLRDQGADAGKGDKERLLDALEKTGLLLSCPHEGGGGGRLFRLGFAEGAGAVAEKNPTVVADSDFSFTLYPEISYEDAVALAQALDIRSAGTVTRFEMTRESASRAFDRNIPAADITRLLQRLSAGRISDVFVWTVNEWEKRYGEVSLRTGLVLSLCEERRYLAGTKALAGLIRETLAPGLYLLHESAQGEAAAALAAAGVDMVCTKRPSADRVPDGAPYGVPDGSSWEKGARNYFSLPAASGDATVIAGG
ncbi:MAG: helicase-associated domain-containing protein, partial [Spirochaetes bacterium]|nr:helicase-associated domain-containing protein [Spirochaetota bacterium]